MEDTLNDAGAEAPKKPVRRTRKAVVQSDGEPAKVEKKVPATRKPTTRTRKVAAAQPTTEGKDSAGSRTAQAAGTDRPVRKRATKAPQTEAPAPKPAPTAGQTEEAQVADPPKRRRGRPRKNPLPDEMTRMTQEATKASAQIMPAPAATLGEADSKDHVTRRPGDHGGQSGDDSQRQEVQHKSSASDQGAPTSSSRRRHVQHNDHPQSGSQGQTNQSNGSRPYRNEQYQGRNRNGNNNQGGRHRNRHNNASQAASVPSLSRETLATMKVAELREKASELSVPFAGVKKGDLAEAIYLAAARAEGFRDVTGILDVSAEGYGFVRTGNYMAGDEDAFVPQQMIKQLGLRRGDKVSGTVRPSRPNDKYPAVSKVSSINDEEPEKMAARPRFRDLTPIYPNESLVMEHGKDSITGRAIDLVAPIGKGQRGLIVSPPKAGKTTVLKKVCEAIAANNPEVFLICLLVDERPEEVTDMERSIHGDVVASTFDMPADNHTAVAELVIERAKRMVELGRDVVVVLDSITRLARAYNLAQPASGKILSGGVDSAALYPPKRFLGAARNIENGGSLTILASALVDTGSKMDEVIFEEFKGTGNMELKLDRDLADKRIFPAIDPVASGTRNEELLLDAELSPLIWGIRRILANMNNTERAELALIKGLRQTKSNEEFLIRSAKKAQQSDYVDTL